MTEHVETSILTEIQTTANPKEAFEHVTSLLLARTLTKRRITRGFEILG